MKFWLCNFYCTCGPHPKESCFCYFALHVGLLCGTCVFYFYIACYSHVAEYCSTSHVAYTLQNPASAVLTLHFKCALQNLFSDGVLTLHIGRILRNPSFAIFALHIFTWCGVLTILLITGFCFTWKCTFLLIFTLPVAFTLPESIFALFMLHMTHNTPKSFWSMVGCRWPTLTLLSIWQITDENVSQNTRKRKTQYWLK